MLPLAPPFASPSELIFDGASAEDFLCRSVNYEEIASLALPEGVHINQKPGDLSFVRSFSGRSAYGPVNGRVEIEAAVSLRGQTAHSENRISFTFSAPVCPANFSTEIANALSKFDEFRYGAIKLTPHPVVEVVEGGSDYALGAEAYWAKNYTFALMKFLSAAKENPRAYNYIGDMYQNGQGVAQDYHQAFTWYVKAAELGDALGQSHLGHFYLMGLGTTRDFAEAFAWYSKAANQGDAYSEASLAGLYAKGIGVTRDYELARQWYLKAAEQNDSRSQALLAHFYQDSESPLRDDQQAAYWYRRAADGGYQPAEVELGLLYANGRGVPLDREGAVEWFRKAAAQDNAWAQYHLGDAYEKGLGVAQDVQQAIAWYSKAANRGYAEARSRLDALCATHGPCL
jgi:TPR repeat protein